ncbi:Basic-leucine zipper domain [Trinorchestia longiramus]|nr:Basic-leucine zipper domain [Trinorchestia longiramus]
MIELPSNVRSQEGKQRRCVRIFFPELVKGKHKVWLHIMSPIRGRRTLHDSDRAASDNSDDPSYKEKRTRNNHAVKKSREKAKEKTREMEKKVETLKKENDSLQTKIDFLQGELERLKNTFISHAGGSTTLTLFNKIHSFAV